MVIEVITIKDAAEFWTEQKDLHRWNNVVE